MIRYTNTSIICFPLELTYLILTTLIIKLLADLKRLWKPTDREKLEQLEIVARGLLNDKDRDVSELAFRAITQMDYIRTHTMSNDAEERENRARDREELLLMDLEPKKAGQAKSGPEVKEAKPGKSAKSKLVNTHYPVMGKSGSSSSAKEAMTRSMDFGGRHQSGGGSGQLTDAYNIRERKKESSREVVMSADVAQISVRSKRTGEVRRSSLNSENFNREWD